MIQLHKISLSFGSQIIFDDITLNISPHVRMGLVGRNGSGKSTLLKAIADGGKNLDDGNIATNNLSVAYIPQDIVLISEKNILDEACTDFESLDPEDFPRAIVEAKKMLQGLGFSPAQLEQPVTQLSTGWKMRLLLAKLLLKKADFYLFDEPTNHLDIFAQEWFLEFLQQAPFGFMLVCHERAFLNKTCDTILELERGKATVYKGAYDDYVVQKEEQRERLRAAQSLQQKEIARMQALADKFRASASKASFAQSLLRKIEKMDIIEVPEEDVSRVTIKFPPVERAAKQVLTISGVSKMFQDRLLFKNVAFTIERDMKVALVAANGVGKTTLFKIITGELQKDSGAIEFGSNVHYAIFKQNQHENLNPRATIWEEVLNVPCKKSEADLRRMLGAFIFSGESIHKKTSALSGGEKNRLCMLKTLLHESNFLMLDEPTNHLDIVSKDTLLKALKAYPGTLLFVSHDQDFVNNLATHILELTQHGTTLYKGNFDEFLEQKKYREERDNSLSINDKSSSKAANPINTTNELHKKVSSLASSIEKLERKIEDLGMQLAEYEYGTNSYDRIFTELTKIQEKLEMTNQEWERTVLELEKQTKK
jgi:ATP-binding cassette, subfamily F, member 3